MLLEPKITECVILKQFVKTVWPELGKFRHFGKKIHLWPFPKGLFSIWRNFEPTFSKKLCFWVNGQNLTIHQTDVCVHVVKLNCCSVRVEEKFPLRSDKSVEIGNVTPRDNLLIRQEEVARVDGMLVGAPNQSWRKVDFSRQTVNW